MTWRGCSRRMARSGALAVVMESIVLSESWCLELLGGGDDDSCLAERQFLVEFQFEIGWKKEG